jgi:sentrin-specific protease 1
MSASPFAALNDELDDALDASMVDQSEDVVVMGENESRESETQSPECKDDQQRSISGSSNNNNSTVLNSNNSGEAESDRAQPLGFGEYLASIVTERNVTDLVTVMVKARSTEEKSTESWGHGVASVESDVPNSLTICAMEIESKEPHSLSAPQTSDGNCGGVERSATSNPPSGFSQHLAEASGLGEGEGEQPVVDGHKKYLALASSVTERDVVDLLTAMVEAQSTEEKSTESWGHGVATVESDVPNSLTISAMETSSPQTSGISGPVLPTTMTDSVTIDMERLAMSNPRQEEERRHSSNNIVMEESYSQFLTLAASGLKEREVKRLVNDIANELRTSSISSKSIGHVFASLESGVTNSLNFSSMETSSSLTTTTTTTMTNSATVLLASKNESGPTTFNADDDYHVDEEEARQLPFLMRPLTSDESALVQNVMYGIGPEHEIFAQAGSDSVQRGSIFCLQPGRWLNDEVIHYFCVMLAARDKELCHNHSSRKRSHFFKSFFMTKLLNEGNDDKALEGKYDYENVKGWSKNAPGNDIFKLDKIFFPINKDGTHWICAVAFVQERRIQMYDSLGSDGMHYLQCIFHYIKDEHQDKKETPLPDVDHWKLVPCTRDTPRQQNGEKCFVSMLGGLS